MINYLLSYNWENEDQVKIDLQKYQIIYSHEGYHNINDLFILFKLNNQFFYFWNIIQRNWNCPVKWEIKETTISDIIEVINRKNLPEEIFEIEELKHYRLFI